MKLNRRKFLAAGTGLVLGTACTSGRSAGVGRQSTTTSRPPAGPGGQERNVASRSGDHSLETVPLPGADSSWGDVRSEFQLDPNYVNLAGFLLAPHPREVRSAIERHRYELDRNPVLYTKNRLKFDAKVRAAAAGFLGGQPDEICLTDSTTMGLGVIYGGLELSPGQEILFTKHAHYSTRVTMQLRAARDGVQIREVPLYASSSEATTDEIVGRLLAALSDKTRVIAVTWVHSSSGLKLPVRAISDAVAEVNRKRAPGDQMLLCVDGVHGLGAENFKVADLGCDFFIAGTHKWLFGPRGTGIVWGRKQAWSRILPLIAPFELPGFIAHSAGRPVPREPAAVMATPGGYHSFEHRWAVKEAFEFQTRLGRDRIQRRIHMLNRRLKEGLSAMKHVQLYTPMSEALSSGFTMFDVNGMKPKEVVNALLERKLMGSTTPYVPSFARLAPGILNTEADVDSSLQVIRTLA